MVNIGCQVNFYIPPLRCCYNFTDLELDFTTIAAGLLHDVVEDTDYTISDIEKEFGSEIALWLME